MSRARTGQTGHDTHADEPVRRWQAKFLAELARTGIVSDACRAAGIHRNTAYLWREQSDHFRQGWEQAEATATEAMEAEMRRRAVEGCRRPVFQQGRQVGEVTEYSDALLMFMLRARAPEKYRENHRIEHVGAGGRPLVTEIVVRLNEDDDDSNA